MSARADVEVRLAGGGECTVVHALSGATLRTAKSPQYGGSGRSFSSTDLLAVAMATCIATDLEPVAERNGVAPARISIHASKTLSTAPKRVAALDVVVHVEGDVDDTTLLKLRRAADACVVQRALRDDVEVRIDVTRVP